MPQRDTAPANAMRGCKTERQSFVYQQSRCLCVFINGPPLFLPVVFLRFSFLLLHSACTWVSTKVNIAYRASWLEPITKRGEHTDEKKGQYIFETSTSACIALPFLIILLIFYYSVAYKRRRLTLLCNHRPAHKSVFIYIRQWKIRLCVKRAIHQKSGFTCVYVELHKLKKQRKKN